MTGGEVQVALALIDGVLPALWASAPRCQKGPSAPQVDAERSQPKKRK